MQNQHIVIVGANSAIALATARIYAKSGAKFTLLARNAEKLEATRNDLLARGRVGQSSLIPILSPLRFSGRNEPKAAPAVLCVVGFWRLKRVDPLRWLFGQACSELS